MLTKEECIKALSRMIKSHLNGVLYGEDTKILKQLINEHFELLEKHEQLEQALYIACAIIDGNFGVCPLGQFDIELSQCENNCEDNSVCCWAEWCLKEAKKQ